MAMFAPKQRTPASPVSTGPIQMRLATARSLSALLPAICYQPAATTIMRRPNQTSKVKDASSSVSRLDFTRIPVHSLAAPTIQAKLIVNRPGDGYEQEADRVAEQVMRMPAPSAPLSLMTSTGTAAQSNTCGGSCEQREQGSSEHEHIPALRTQATDGTSAPTSVHQVLRSPGQPLDAATRAFMEPRFGWDFSRIRIHTDPAAEQSARHLNAHAYTVGEDVVFGAGQFAPGASQGKRLLAHELTHVVQQTRRGLSRQVETSCVASIVQRQHAQTSDLPAAADPPDRGYDESAKAPSYRVRVIAHASPRWRGASNDKQADQLNLELSKKRADEVGSEVEKLLAKHLPSGSTVSVEASSVLTEGTVGVEEEARGSRDTLHEAAGNRKDNAQQRRRVDVIVSPNQVITGSAGASRPLLRRPTASKFWHVNVAFTAGGSVGAAASYSVITLTNDLTGETMQGHVLSLGGGPEASLGASISLSDSTGFMTSEPMDFEDFEGQWVTLTTAGASLVVGYSGTYLTFRSIRTAPKDISVGGWSVGTVGAAAGSITSGKFHYGGTPADHGMPPSYPPTTVPIEHTDETSIPYSRTESGEYKFEVLFPTGESALSDVETAYLDSILASIAASSRP